jgi:hypothetical protein
MLDRFKRVALPLAVALVIIVALVYRLSSCAPDKSGSARGAVSSPVAAADTPVDKPPSLSAAPSSESLVTDEDIRKVFSKYNFEVRSIINAGDTAVVEFFYPKCSGLVPARYAWVDRASGAYDIVTDGLLTDKFTVMPDGRLMVLTTGLDFTSNAQLFPEIFVSTYTADEASPFTVRYHAEIQPYYMPLARTFTVGGDIKSTLKSLSFSFDSVSAGFDSPRADNAAAPEEGGAPPVPKTGVVCSGGLCYITFYNTGLSPGFQAPKPGTGDGLRTFVSIESDGANTLLTLKLGANAQRYHMASASSPDDGTPYTVFTFRPDSSVAYPPGW